MAFSRFLGCFLCGSDTRDARDLPPAAPVQFDIGGKELQISPKSDDSFDSEPGFAKDEKTPLATDIKPVRRSSSLVIASRGTPGFIEEQFFGVAHEKEAVISNHARALSSSGYKSAD